MLLKTIINDYQKKINVKKIKGSQNMEELTLSREAKTSLHKMINQTPNMEPKDIALAIGSSHKTVCNYANMNMHHHVPSLQKVEAMMMYTQNPALLKVWAHKLGFMLVPVGQTDKDQQLSLMESLLALNIGNGQMNQHVHNILADGEVTPSELDETIPLVEEIRNGLTMFLNAVEQDCQKTLASRQTKKA